MKQHMCDMASTTSYIHWQTLSMSQPLSSAELFAHLDDFATGGNFYTAIFNEVSKVSRDCFYFA